MTTIAYRDGIIACDSRATWLTYDQPSYVVSDEVEKSVALTHVLHGDITVVGCGDFEAYRQFLGSVNMREPRSEVLVENTTVLVAMGRSKRLHLWKEDGPRELNKDAVYAFGSGRPYALGALLAGASAEYAVRVAAHCDRYTNSNIVVRRVWP